MRPLLARLLARLRRRQLDRDLADEISAHLDFAAADHVARGLPPDEARRAARQRLGGALQTTEAYRDRQGFPLLESMWQDARHGVRALRRTPGFSAVAALSLALGIGANTAFTLDVEPAAAGFSALRDRFATPLVVLMAVVGLLLLIACTNIASLLLARGAARQREMAVRVALGAGRLRLVRQTLTESLLLSAIGGVAGVFLAYVGADALTRIILSGREFVALPQHIEIDRAPVARVLLFAASVAGLTSVLFGLAPAWRAFASAPARSLREVGGVGETRARQLFGKGLVVAQIALSVVLLSTAGLFLRHLSHLRNVDLGFQRDSVLLVTLDPRGSGYNRYQLSRLYRELLGRLHAIPGVRSATLSAVTPIEGPGASRFANVEGFQERPEERRYISLNGLGPKYFETLGTPLLAGRDFAFEDDARVAIVNQAMARHYFRETSPLGKHITFDGDAMPYEIVGVVGDAKYLDLHDAAPQTIYLNSFQEGRIFSQFALRARVPPTSVAAEVRRAVRDVLKTVRVAKVTTLRDQVDASIVPERLVAMLATFFGALGALLAAIGLYGLLAYAVARRTREIGVRMALGATERRATAMVLKSALGLVVAGLVIGVPMAAWGQRVAASLVEHLTIDPFPLAGAAAGMVGIALLAAYLPARRAARVQPLDALRHS